ncbi:Outer membrane protein TolC [Xylanibacter ruminicola]|uniref:Outer membrane protein TolC n=1 Tax=Xylanibacter ruminicola TaxID=839 RepID=A0A1M7GKG1_XYLRU|nr:TolC family protein [Xylanibacter ruminicola]SHM16417.1 Outer membrane protein TolC [Xylanibacter ruminicola]
MKKLFLSLTMLPMLAQGQTLDDCQQAAEKNYPLIQQYGLIEKTTQLTVANIQKGWLPQVSAQAQATYQSDVTAWPSEMKAMMSGMGIDMRGLTKDQYRVGIDVQQTIYDGGVIGSQKRIAREQGKVQAAQNEVNIYHVRKRVNEMYFGLLLIDEQIKLNNDLQAMLAGNERKLESMTKRGTAAESDLQSVKAERLNAVQKGTELVSQKQMLQRMLSTFCGIEVNNIQKPQVKSDGRNLATGNQRPELKVLDAQISVLNAQEKALNAALMPKVGVFAQGFYGYPGLNMFEDMMRHKWSLNGLVGARVTWTIGALYTRKNDKAKLQLQRDMTENSREVFLFNNKLERIQQHENIVRYQKQMAQDGEIILLRSAVRKAAESKLAHGIIDVNDLVCEINQEHAACVQQSVHEIEMLKEIYDNKYTTNN